MPEWSADFSTSAVVLPWPNGYDAISQPDTACLPITKQLEGFRTKKGSTFIDVENIVPHHRSSYIRAITCKLNNQKISRTKTSVSSLITRTEFFLPFFTASMRLTNNSIITDDNICFIAAIHAPHLLTIVTLLLKLKIEKTLTTAFLFALLFTMASRYRSWLDVVIL